MAAFVKAISVPTARAEIGGTNQGFEKELAFGRDPNTGEVIVTGIALGGSQGGSISSLMGPDVIAVAHVHYATLDTTLAQPPNGADDLVERKYGISSFVIGATGTNVWEVGKVNGNIDIRSVGNSNRYGAWEGYQIHEDSYRLYNGSKYPI